MDTFQHFISTLFIFLAGAFGTGSAPSGALPVPTYADVVTVIDGDTIVVSVDGKEEFVRYIGIDTPETAHGTDDEECYAKEATERNARLLAAGQVQLEEGKENRDKYGRLLRYVYADDIFVNRALVEEGYATALPIKPNTAHAREFYELQQSAKAQNLGLWSACR